MNTPRALEALSRHLGAQPIVPAAEPPALRWREMPDPGRVSEVRVACPAGRAVLYLHPRQGAWFDDGRDPAAARLLGVIEDALVFTRQTGEALECVRALLSASAAGGARPLEAFDDAGLGAGLARAPRLDALGVLEWGPFPHAVPEDAARHAFSSVPGAITVILRAISAEANGPRQTRIAHRPARE